MTGVAPKFAKESDLCAAFIAAVPKPWVAYPESEGWDILIINAVDGRQIGIEAKLKLNAKVMAQAVEGPSWHGAAGPDYRAVLVPEDQRNDLTALAPFCGVTIIGMSAPGRWGTPQFWPHFPVDHPHITNCGDWHERLPIARHRVPEYVPDVVAGASAPMQLTAWKIAALKLAVLLDETGYLTRDDFKRFQIDIRRWIGVDGWLQVGNGGFVKGPRYPDFKSHHPKVWAEILAAPEKWSRPVKELAL